MEEISNQQHGNIFKWDYAVVPNSPMITTFILNVNNSSQGNYGIVWNDLPRLVFEPSGKMRLHFELQ